MAENQSKKKVFLPAIAEKLEIGTSVKMLCREYGVSQHVIHRIRREYKFLSNFGNCGGTYCNTKIEEDSRMKI